MTGSPRITGALCGGSDGAAVLSISQPLLPECVSTLVVQLSFIQLLVIIMLFLVLFLFDIPSIPSASP